MPRYRAVLFDWMLTVAHYPTDEEFCRAALASLDRPIDHEVVQSYARACEQARMTANIAEKLTVEDTSISMHRAVNMEVFALAGLDRELSEAWYTLLGRPDMHPLYPDTTATLAALRSAGVRVAIISDIHVDLRRHATEFGVAPDIPHWSLSFELGVQKPHPVMFSSAIDALGVRPDEALMVGDRASRDGAASKLGIDTLILPSTGRYATRGLDRVIHLAVAARDA